MFLVYVCRQNNGKTTYDQNSLIGLYDDFSKAKKDLMDYLNASKYSYDLEVEFSDYLFINCFEKNQIEIPENNAICFEITHKHFQQNKINAR